MSFIKIPLNQPTSNQPIILSSKVIDSDVDTFGYHLATLYSTPGGTEIDYIFSNPIPSPSSVGKNGVFIEKISIRTKDSGGGRVVINDGAFETSYTDSSPTVLTYVDIGVNQTFDSISNITVFIETNATTSTEAEFYYIEIHGRYENIPNYNFEFNDSVLETKGWNSSRYDGRQLSAAKINEFTAGDITYGKTPVVERYTRNIYIGNEVVGIDPTSLDDNSLLPIENFSYLQSNYYITINEDETITHNRLEKTKTKPTEKIGFYQAFFDDFPEDETCNVVVFDNTVKNNLKSSYKVYFNGGQLQQLLKYESHTQITNFQLASHFKVEYQKAYNRTRIFRKPSGIQSSQVVAADITINPLNKHIIREFFPQDLDIAGDAQGDAVKRTAKRHVDVYKKAFNFKDNSDYKGNKRFFLSFIKDNGSTIRTIATGSIPTASNTPIRTENLAELSTIEIISASLDPSDVSFPLFLELNGVEKHPLNQDYNAQKSTTTWGSAGTPSLPSLNDITPPDIHGLVFSRVTDDVPSLLVNLNKTNELRSGGGKFPYIIIPKNLHPYIKDNLKLYLSKAGINVGGDATQTIDEIIANKPRKPRLTPGVRKAISRGRRRGLLREEESNRDRRQRERENRRKKRKQNRENRKENRQENRQKRRENREERRENRRGNRQDRRQNRRNRRRNR